MIADVCIFYNENELFFERFHALKYIVDKFFVIEYSKTFSGKAKDKYFNLTLFSESEREKIIYRFVESPEPINENSQIKIGFTPVAKSFSWKHHGELPINLEQGLRREIAQRDNIILVLDEFLSDDDVVIMSDVDEIPAVEAVKANLNNLHEKVLYFEMDWRIFYSNFRCVDMWYGSYMTTFAVVKRYSLDLLRVASPVFPFGKDQKIASGGIHLSYLGGVKVIRNKLSVLPYQGLRADLTKWLINYVPFVISVMLWLGKDLLFQNRKFTLLNVSDAKVANVSDKFIKKYAKRLR